MLCFVLSILYPLPSIPCSHPITCDSNLFQFF
jgi:hypothetical protein